VLNLTAEEELLLVVADEDRPIASDRPHCVTYRRAIDVAF
jgi:hypothetical protein